jgi:hypothetical protein
MALEEKEINAKDAKGVKEADLQNKSLRLFFRASFSEAKRRSEKLFITAK